MQVPSATCPNVRYMYIAVRKSYELFPHRAPLPYTATMKP